MIKNRILAFILFVVFFIGFYNLLDYILVSAFSESVFVFSVGLNLCAPLVVSVISGYLLIYRRGKKKKDDKNGL